MQLGKTNAMSRVRIVGLVVGLGVVVIVQKDSTTGNSVDCPVMNAAAVVWGITYEVGAFGLCELDCTGNLMMMQHTPL